MEQAGQGVGRATDSRPTKEEEEGTEHHPRDREATERPLPTRAVAMARQAAATVPVLVLVLPAVDMRLRRMGPPAAVRRRTRPTRGLPQAPTPSSGEGCLHRHSTVC